MREHFWGDRKVGDGVLAKIVLKRHFSSCLSVPMGIFTHTKKYDIEVCSS